MPTAILQLQLFNLFILVNAIYLRTQNSTPSESGHFYPTSNLKNIQEIQNILNSMQSDFKQSDTNTEKPISQPQKSITSLRDDIRTICSLISSQPQSLSFSEKQQLATLQQKTNDAIDDFWYRNQNKIEDMELKYVIGLNMLSYALRNSCALDRRYLRENKAASDLEGSDLWSFGKNGSRVYYQIYSQDFLVYGRVVKCPVNAPFRKESSCIRCSVGQFFDLTQSTCTTCAFGEFLNTTVHSCQQPIIVYVTNPFSTEEIITESFTQYLNNQSKILRQEQKAMLCPLQKPYSILYQCISCSEPYFFNADLKQCQECLGFIQNHACHPTDPTFSNPQASKQIIRWNTFVRNRKQRPCPLQTPFYVHQTKQCISCLDQQLFDAVEDRCIAGRVKINGKFSSYIPDCPYGSQYNALLNTCEYFCPQGYEFDNRTKRCEKENEQNIEIEPEREEDSTSAQISQISKNEGKEVEKQQKLKRQNNVTENTKEENEKKAQELTKKQESSSQNKSLENIPISIKKVPTDEPQKKIMQTEITSKNQTIISQNNTQIEEPTQVQSQTIISQQQYNNNTTSNKQIAIQQEELVNKNASVIEMEQSQKQNVFKNVSLEETGSAQEKNNIQIEEPSSQKAQTQNKTALSQSSNQKNVTVTPIIKEKQSQKQQTISRSNNSEELEKKTEAQEEQAFTELENEQKFQKQNQILTQEQSNLNSSVEQVIPSSQQQEEVQSCQNGTIWNESLKECIKDCAYFDENSHYDYKQASCICNTRYNFNESALICQKQSSSSKTSQPPANITQFQFQQKLIDNLTDSSWISHNATQVYEQFLQNKNDSSYYRICPALTPFAINQTCIACTADQVFDLQLRSCIVCPNKTHYNSSKHVCAPVILYQTDINQASKLILGQKSLDEWLQINQQSKQDNPSLEYCPQQLPYFNGIECISCTDPSPYFNLQKLSCDTCQTGTVYEQKQRSCIQESAKPQQPSLQRLFASVFQN